MQVIFTRLAERQVADLYEYIARQTSEARADTYVARIIVACEGLATFPKRGSRRDDLLPGLRAIGFERRVTIAFVVTSEAVLSEAFSMADRILRQRSERSDTLHVGTSPRQPAGPLSDQELFVD